MKWLIKLLGGYTEEEYREQVMQNNYYKFGGRLDLFKPIERALNELKIVIGREQYGSINQAIFSITDELKRIMEDRNDLTDVHELLNKIEETRISLQNSNVEKMEKFTEVQGDAIRHCLTVLKSNNDFSKLSFKTNSLIMSNRAHNALDRAEYDIVGEIVVLGVEELSKINGMGKKSLEEISKAMEEIGVAFDMQLPEEIKNAITSYTSAKRNITSSPIDESLKGIIFEGDAVLPWNKTTKEFDIKEVNIETRMIHIKNLAKAIESYRASVGKSWKILLRVNWSFDNFDPIHSEYVRYLKAINETGGARFIVSISSSTTLAQIESKSKNAFLGNSEFFKKLLSHEEV